MAGEPKGGWDVMEIICDGCGAIVELEEPRTESPRIMREIPGETAGRVTIYDGNTAVHQCAEGTYRH